MKPSDDLLDRLLNVAALARRPFIAEVPFSLESRVLSAWRRARFTEDAAAGTALVFLFRAGLALAAAILLATVALNFSKLTTQENDPDFGLTSATMDLVAMK